MHRNWTHGRAGLAADEIAARDRRGSGSGVTSYSGAPGQWRRLGEGGKLSPLWVDVQKLCNMRVLSLYVMELLRVTRQMRCKAVEQRDNTTGTGGHRTLDPL